VFVAQLNERGCNSGYFCRFAAAQIVFTQPLSNWVIRHKVTEVRYRLKQTFLQSAANDCLDEDFLMRAMVRPFGLV